MSDSESERQRLYIHSLIGGSYDEFMASTKRYQVIKGSRASKKTHTIAYKIIMLMIHFHTLNVLVVRKVFATLKDSCFAKLKKVVYAMGYQKFFKFTVSPLEIEYLPTGQKILFRGLDEPQKLASIEVTNGILAQAWIEENSQLNTLREFQLVDQLIRGQVEEPGLYKCIYISMNPWSRHHWSRTEFFETEDGRPLNRPDTLAMTTTYKCNEWLDKADAEFFERMRIQNPQLYQVAGLGEWGNPEGLIYNNWEEKDFDINDILKKPNIQAIFGCDFGFATDPSAMVYALVDHTNYTIYVCDELYETHLTTKMLSERIKDKGWATETIVCDSAQPSDIWELQNEYGITNAVPCRKYPGSVLSGIQRLQGYTLAIHSRCVNFLTEIQNYAWKVDKDGHTLLEPAKFSMDHLLDALRYASEYIGMGNGAFLGEIGSDDLSTPPTQRKGDDDTPDQQPGKEDEEDDDDDDESSLCYSL